MNERDWNAISSALAQRGENPAALFKRHGELAKRKLLGEPLTPAEEVELEAVRCALDVTECLDLWEGQMKRAEAAERERDALRIVAKAAREVCSIIVPQKHSRGPRAFYRLRDALNALDNWRQP